jgi:hypothetical protein
MFVSCVYIVTYVRFPWLNNVSTAVTMASTTLLHFLSNATIETETFRLLWRGDIKESWNELVSGCARELEELGQLLVWDLKRVDTPVVFGALLIVI